MADKQQLIDIEALSHFKAKQDIENAKKFKSKDEATDLKGAVRYDAAQALTEQEKAQAKANLGITDNGGSNGGTVEGAVRHDVEQALDEDDKARARANIGTTDGTWENMPDKPFYETGLKVEWDGEYSVEEPLDYTDTLNAMIYKISNKKLLKSEVVGAAVELYLNGVKEKITLTDEVIFDMNDDCYFIGMSDAPFVAVTSKATTVDVEGVPVEIKSEGVWFIKHSMGYASYFETSNYGIKTIDKKFIPDGLEAVCHITPFAILVPKDDKYFLYKLSDKIFGGLETEPEEACINIITDNFLLPFVLFSAIPADTTKDFVVTIATEYDSETETFSGVEVNLGKVNQKLLSDNYLITVQKKTDGSYMGSFLHNPSAIAPLDSNGLIPSQYLPSFVDDVVEGYYNEEDNLFYKDNKYATLITGETGKIYVDKESSNTYRWSGSQYVRMNPDEYKMATNADIDALFT